MSAAPAVRDMTAADLPAVRAIFNHAVDHTTAIWSETHRTETEQAEWFESKRAANWPCLVAADGDAVLGYAALGPFRPQPGFRHTAEHAVYVAENARRRGVGRALVAAILGRAMGRGLRVVIAAVSGDNPGSLALHESTRVPRGRPAPGRRREVGRPAGRGVVAV